MGKRARLRRQRALDEAATFHFAGEKCATCAYREGTPASLDQGDFGLSEKRRLLLSVAQPFYCHEKGPVRRSRRKLCVGHMEAMAALHAKGHYSDPDEMARRLDHTRKRWPLIEQTRAKVLHACGIDDIDA